jgi:hypothetical protein
MSEIFLFFQSEWMSFIFLAMVAVAAVLLGLHKGGIFHWLFRTLRGKRDKAHLARRFPVLFGTEVEFVPENREPS